MAGSFEEYCQAANIANRLILVFPVVNKGTQGKAFAPLKRQWTV